MYKTILVAVALGVTLAGPKVSAQQAQESGIHEKAATLVSGPVLPALRTAISYTAVTSDILLNQSPGVFHDRTPRVEIRDLSTAGPEDAKAIGEYLRSHRVDVMLLRQAAWTNYYVHLAVSEAGIPLNHVVAAAATSFGDHIVVFAYPAGSPVPDSL